MNLSHALHLFQQTRGQSRINFFLRVRVMLLDNNEWLELPVPGVAAQLAIKPYREADTQQGPHMRRTKNAREPGPERARSLLCGCPAFSAPAILAFLQLFANALY